MGSLNQGLYASNNLPLTNAVCWFLLALGSSSTLGCLSHPSDKGCLSDKSIMALGWRGRWFFQTILWLGGFPTLFVPVQHLKRAFQRGALWSVGLEEGKINGLPKATVSSVCSKAFGCSCHRHWRSTQFNPSVIPLGMGALEDARGSCASQRPICTGVRLPAAQETSGPSGADLQSVSLGQWGTSLPLFWGGGGMLDAPRSVITETLYQAPTCWSWRTWKSYESAECVSGWGGEHRNNDCCGRQYIMAGLPAWKVNAIILCVCFSQG